MAISFPAADQVASSLKSISENIFGRHSRRRAVQLSSSSEACELRQVPTGLGAAPEIALVYQDEFIAMGMVNDDSEGQNSIAIAVDYFDDGIIDDVISADYDSAMDDWYWNYALGQFSGTPVDIDIRFTPVENNGSQSQSGDSLVITIEGQ